MRWWKNNTLLKQRAVTEFLHAEGIRNASEIHRRFLVVYRTNTLDASNVCQRVRKSIFLIKVKWFIMIQEMITTLLWPLINISLALMIFFWEIEELNNSKIFHAYNFERASLWNNCRFKLSKHLCSLYARAADMRKQWVVISNKILDRIRREWSISLQHCIGKRNVGLPLRSRRKNIFYEIQKHKLT